MPPSLVNDPIHQLLGGSALRAELLAYLRRRGVDADAEDVVQTTLTALLKREPRPVTAEDVRRLAYGILRNAAANTRRRREQPADPSLLDELATSDAPTHDARELLDWAEARASSSADGPRTLEWMLREADGEKLEHIALAEAMPAPLVRQRVSRLRRVLRSQWLAACVIGSALLAGLVLEHDRRALLRAAVVDDTPNEPEHQPMPPLRELRVAPAVERQRVLEKVTELRRFDPLRALWYLRALDQADPTGARARAPLRDAVSRDAWAQLNQPRQRDPKSPGRWFTAPDLRLGMPDPAQPRPTDSKDGGKPGPR